MKAYAGSALFVLAATGLMGFHTSANAADLAQLQNNNSVRIAVANEIPYGYIASDGEPRGVGPEVIMHIVNELGIDNIEWMETSFGELIPGIEADEFDIVAAEMAILPERCQRVAFSIPNTSYGEGLLVAKDNPKDLHNYEAFVEPGNTIAFVTGANQQDMLEALGVPEANMVVISDNDDAADTIRSGKADAYAATGQTVGHLADEHDAVEAADPFQDPVVNGDTVRSWGGFVVSRDAPELLDAINDALRKIKGTEQWHAIQKRYNFSDRDVAYSFEALTEKLCAID